MGTRHRRTRRLLTALFAGICLLLGALAGGAYAYWKTAGSGSGTGSVQSPGNVVVLAATGTATGAVYPGGPATDLRVTVNNANNFSVNITSVSQVGSPIAVGGSGTCTTTGASITPTTGLNIVVLNGVRSFSIPGVVTMDLTSDSGCQGAQLRFQIALTVQR